MKVTALVENNSYDQRFACEHGLSLFIETAERTILFDMGQTDLFAVNAQKMGIDLSLVDVAVLSHGHYDHGGGLNKFLQINRKAAVYLHTTAFDPYYNAIEKYIGIPCPLSQNRFIYTEGKTVIAPGLTLYSGKDLLSCSELATHNFKAERNGRRIEDDFRHEQYLIIEEDSKNVLFTGCSHRGILGIMNKFRPHVLVGGFHLSKLPLDDKMKSCALELSHFPADYYTCHCTGIAQFEFMKTYIPRLHYLSTGQSIDLP